MKECVKLLHTKRIQIYSLIPGPCCLNIIENDVKTTGVLQHFQYYSYIEQILYISVYSGISMSSWII